MEFAFWNLPAEAGIALRIVFTILAFAVAGKIGTRLIDALMRPDRLPGAWDDRRVNTLRGLARSMLRYSLYFFGGVMVLDQMGVKVTAILAGVGVLGLAVGFGAQNLVRDVITGFFILFEDQYAVGDYITAAGVTGTVEELGLRVSRIKSSTGEVHIIPNGKIEQVTNYSRGGMGVVVDVDVAYESDLDQVIEVINSACHTLAQEKIDIVVDEPKVLGVTNLGESSVTIQVFGVVQPMQQWAFARELRKRIKGAFDQAGIEIPYPHRVILSKQTPGIFEQSEEGRV